MSSTKSDCGVGRVSALQCAQYIWIVAEGSGGCKATAGEVTQFPMEGPSCHLFLQHLREKELCASGWCFHNGRLFDPIY